MQRGNVDHTPAGLQISFEIALCDWYVLSILLHKNCFAQTIPSGGWEMRASVAEYSADKIL